MVEIKTYSPEYREDVQMICRKTGPGEALTVDRVRDYILSAYCNYYIDNEPENVFVLVDESNRAQGYIFCAEDYKKYLKKFKPYLKRIRQTGIRHYAETLAEISGHLVFSKKYPAHLHINLNEDFRGGGNGSKMIETLCEHLRKKNVGGVMLITGQGNTGAVRFYKRNGFRTLLRLFGGEIMAKEL